MEMFTFTGNREAIHREVRARRQASADLMSDIARQSADFATEDTDYLLRMGVSRALLTDIVYRQRAVPTATGGPTRRCLTEAELRRYFVVNEARRGSPESPRQPPPVQK